MKSVKRFIASSVQAATAQEVFDYHDRPGALRRLIPPWKNVEVESSDGSLLPGSSVVLRLKMGPLRLRWIAEHTEYERPSHFVDRQHKGPFAHWVHRHCFEEASSIGSVLRDEIEYKLPLGPVGALFGGRLARQELETMFAYRHRVTHDDLELATKCDQSPMTIAVSGGSGMVGKNLIAFLTLIGHRVIRLERDIDRAVDSEDAIAPWHSTEEAEKLSGVDAVVHLAGKPIADKRWTKEVKESIRSSRVEMTEQLAGILAKLSSPPKVFICASAIGIYGDRGDEELTERSDPGENFLADVAQEWEHACSQAADHGIRTANARLGVVLDPRGGALSKMLTPAKFFGGRLGNGKQWWSWVALDDCIGAIYHAICCSEVSGPFNVTAPQPMRNRDFAKTLGQVISRPAVIPVPAFGLRLAMGEMAGPLLLASTRAVPSVLHETGYTFRFSAAVDALRYYLGKDRLESLE